MTSQQRSQAARTLPDYDHPPVVETALALKFAPIAGWSILHYGQLALAFKKSYSKVEFKPPVGEYEMKLGPSPEAFTFPPVRCWFISEDDSHIVQVQETLFIRNWRAMPDKSAYEHYDEVKPLFERDWRTFCDFLDSAGLKRPEIWQCEVTYINHIIRGREWNTFSDLSRIFRVWNPEGIESKLLQKLETSQFAVSYQLPEDAGRLQFVAQPAVRHVDAKELVQLSITAQIKPSGMSDQELFASLDVGRAAVVNGFTDFTTETAHQIWGIKTP